MTHPSLLPLQHLFDSKHRTVYHAIGAANRGVRKETQCIQKPELTVEDPMPFDFSLVAAAAAPVDGKAEAAAAQVIIGFMLASRDCIPDCHGTCIKMHLVHWTAASAKCVPRLD